MLVKRCVLCMLVRNFLCNVNNTRALIGLCLLWRHTETRFGKIKCSQGSVMGPMAISLWRRIHVFIHLKIAQTLRCDIIIFSAFIQPYQHHYHSTASFRVITDYLPELDDCQSFHCHKMTINVIISVKVISTIIITIIIIISSSSAQ